MAVGDAASAVESKVDTVAATVVGRVVPAGRTEGTCKAHSALYAEHFE